jgi:hypothetical protein
VYVDFDTHARVVKERCANRYQEGSRKGTPETAQHAFTVPGLRRRVIEHQFPDVGSRESDSVEKPVDVIPDVFSLPPKVIGGQHGAILAQRTLATGPSEPTSAHEQRIGMLDAHAPELGEWDPDG